MRFTAISILMFVVSFILLMFSNNVTILIASGIMMAVSCFMMVHVMDKNTRGNKGFNMPI